MPEVYIALAAGSPSHRPVMLVWERLSAGRKTKMVILMHARPGTYALILKSFSDRFIEIGKLGRLHIRPGHYVYVGSAFGPGGLEARIAHHLKISKNPHWHIDYLRPILHLNKIWYTYDSHRLEHRWAATFGGLKDTTIPMAGFGASDCSCESHLFTLTAKPSIRSFRRRFCTHSKVYEYEFHQK